MSKARDEAEAAEYARAHAEMEDRAKLAKGAGEMEVLRNRDRAQAEWRRLAEPKRKTWRQKQGLDD